MSHSLTKSNKMSTLFEQENNVLSETIRSKPLKKGCLQFILNLTTPYDPILQLKKLIVPLL